jgi:DnaA-homolog protein
MSQQLSLPVRLADAASFDNFLVCPQNSGCVARLRQFLARSGASMLIHGPAGSGKTHLLQACCQQVEASGDSIVYLPLAAVLDYPPQDLFAGLEQASLLCLDDISAMAGRRDWEEALFHLFNRCRESATRLLMSAALPPADMGLALADLRSRLEGDFLMRIDAPDDDSLIEALMLRARNRGMAMDPELARYIWQRSPRGMDALLAVLERLDAASLSAGRRLSIPFVKSVLGW